MSFLKEIFSRETLITFIVILIASFSVDGIMFVKKYNYIGVEDDNGTVYTGLLFNKHKVDLNNYVLDYTLATIKYEPDSKIADTVSVIKVYLPLASESKKLYVYDEEPDEVKTFNKYNPFKKAEK